MTLFSPGEVGQAPAPRPVCQVYFGGVAQAKPVWRREALPVGYRLVGPAIVEQMDATTVLDPGAVLVVDGLGNLVITVSGLL